MSKQTLNPSRRPAARRARTKVWQPLLCALALWTAAVRSGTPLAPQQLQDIQASAALGGITIDPDLATETFEDSSVLFVPAAGEPQRMLLYDTKQRRAVVLELLGAEGFGFQLVDPSSAALPVALHLDGDGYFGPLEELELLGISDAALLAQQGALCAQPCFEHGQMPACAACTAVGMLQALQHPAAQAPPAPDATPGSSPTTEPTPAETAEATPPGPVGTETPSPQPVESGTPFETPTPSLPVDTETPSPPPAGTGTPFETLTPSLPVDTETPSPPPAETGTPFETPTTPLPVDTETPFETPTTPLPVDTGTPFETPAPSPETPPDPTSGPGTPTEAPSAAPTPAPPPSPPASPPAVEPNEPLAGEPQ